MITSGTARNILNFIIFQAGWLICILYPTVLSAGIVLLLLMLHLVLVSQNWRTEIQFIGAGVVLGSLLDSAWLSAGVLDISDSQTILAPPWLVAVWTIFMTTLCHSLYWVGKTVWMPFVLAPIAGPFAYWSASELGVVLLTDPVVSLPMLALGWLLLFPLLLFIRRSVYPELEPVE